MDYVIGAILDLGVGTSRCRQLNCAAKRLLSAPLRTTERPIRAPENSHTSKNGRHTMQPKLGQLLLM